MRSARKAFASALDQLAAITAAWGCDPDCERCEHTIAIATARARKLT